MPLASIEMGTYAAAAAAAAGAGGGRGVEKAKAGGLLLAAPRSRISNACNVQTIEHQGLN